MGVGVNCRFESFRKFIQFGNVTRKIYFYKRHFIMRIAYPLNKYKPEADRLFNEKNKTIRIGGLPLHLIQGRIQTALSLFSFFFSFCTPGKLARLVLIYHSNNEDKGLQSHFQLSNSITLFFFFIQGESPFFALDWANLVYSDADEGPGAATALSFSNQPPTFCPEQISFAPRMDFSRPAQWIFPGC